MNDNSIDLISAYLSGQANETEVSELEALILTDAETRAEFLRHTRMDAALSSSAQAPLLQVETDLTGYNHRPNPVKPWSKPSIVRLAAAVVLFAGILFLLFPSTSGVKAHVLSASGRATEDFTPGESVHLKHLRLMQGNLQIKLESGVTLDLAGPNETEFEDAMHLSLRTGSITADVGEHGKGFVIETPNTRIVDLGTRFGVTLHDSGDTDVVVMKGEVEVYRAEQSEMIARLTEGNAIRINSLWVTRRLAAVALSGKSLAILDGKSSREAIVTDVSDSIQEADFHRFYSITTGGMKPGARAYSTLGKPRWQSMPEQDFPKEMLGADVVGTFSDDRKDGNLHLTLQIAKPATIFVMLDSRSKIPDWLRRDFEKTGHQLRCGPWNEVIGTVKNIQANKSGDKYVTYQIWKTDYPTAGSVTLGPAHTADKPRRLAMYGIAVKSIE